MEEQTASSLSPLSTSTSASLSSNALHCDDRQREAIDRQMWSGNQFDQFKAEVLSFTTPEDTSAFKLEDVDEETKAFLRLRQLENIIRDWKCKSLSNAGCCDITILNLDRVLRNKPKIDIIRDIRNVCELTNLEILTLKDNSLEACHFPYAFHKLPKLKSIDLSDNHLEELPRMFLRYSPKLEKIDVSSNRLRSLPIFLLKLPNLNTVYRLHNTFLMSNFDQIQHRLSHRLAPISLSPRSNITLQELCMQTVVAKGLALSGIYLPRTVHQKLEAIAADLRICDNCSKVISGKGYTFLIYPSTFVGLCYVPVTAFTCSQACAEAIYNQWDWLCTEEQTIDETSNQQIDVVTIAKTKDRKRISCCTIQ